nr:hypothetical protein [Tanacetum cinerariifolium]
MLEEMRGISLDSMLDKWHRISKGIANQNGTGNVIAARAEVLEMGINPGDLDEMEEVNVNCILMANLQHASTSGTQLDKAPVKVGILIGKFWLKSSHILALMNRVASWMERQLFRMVEIRPKPWKQN